MIAEIYSTERTYRALQSMRQQVEIAATHLRAVGAIDLHGFSRLSDYVSLQSDASITLRDVTLLNRRGMPTADVMPTLMLRVADLTLIGQRHVPSVLPPSEDLVVEKVWHRILAVTEGHIVEGSVALYPGAELMTFLQASDPPFIPMTDVRVRWLIDRRIRATYPFMLMNRSRVVASSTIGTA